jgi:hypothetical protein
MEKIPCLHYKQHLAYAVWGTNRCPITPTFLVRGRYRLMLSQANCAEWLRHDTTRCNSSFRSVSEQTDRSDEPNTNILYKSSKNCNTAAKTELSFVGSEVVTTVILSSGT